MLSKLTAVGCYHLTGNITYDNQEASNELGCWLHTPSSLLSLQTANLNDLLCCVPDTLPPVLALCTACCLYEELQMKEAERAFTWTIEKTVGNMKEEDKGHTISNTTIFTLMSQIKTYVTIINVPGELQDFYPGSLLEGNKAQWLRDWEMPGHEGKANHVVIAA